MRAIKTEECNLVLKAPSRYKDSIYDLPIFSQDGILYSYWILTDNEIKRLNKGGCIVLSIMSHTHPPVRLTIDKHSEV